MRIKDIMQAAQQFISPGIVTSLPATTLPTHVVFTRYDSQKESTVEVKVVQLNHTDKAFKPLGSFRMNVKNYIPDAVKELQDPFAKDLISAVKRKHSNVKTMHLIPFGDGPSQVFASLGSTPLLSNVAYRDYRNQDVMRMFGPQPTDGS